MIYILIGIILVMVLILLLFLLIPIQFYVRLSKKGRKVAGKYTIGCYGLTFYTGKIPPKKKEEEKKKPKKGKTRDKWDLNRIQKVIGLLLESWPQIEGLIKSFARSLSLEEFSLDITFGLESPADTAIITGYLWSFIYPFKAITGINASIIPNFEESQLDGDLRLKLKFKVYGIVVELVRAFTKKPFRSLFGEIRG